MLLRIFARLRGGVRIAQRVAEVARIEQSEIRDRAARPAPDFVSLNPGYACFARSKLAKSYLPFSNPGLALKTWQPNSQRPFLRQ